MHYKNGREAKAGDVAVNLSLKVAGIIHSPVVGTDTCNARMALITPNDPYVTVKECLHIDDIAAADLSNSADQIRE